MRDDELPPPVVSPDLYDESYFRHACGGSEVWRESGGTRADGIYPGSLARAKLRPGEVVVDIGTGRGELLAVAVRMGAARAIGVEYSAAAVAMARHTIEAHGAGDKAEVMLADARAIPVDDETADLVTLLDVVEHLAPDELSATLREARRVMKPGGRILIHTFPTRTIYDWTYRWQRALSRRKRKTWPSQPRNEYELSMHVNEQTVWSLGRAMRAAGFRNVKAELGQWVYTSMLPDQRAGRLYYRLARVPITAVRALGVSDLWGSATR